MIIRIPIHRGARLRPRPSRERIMLAERPPVAPGRENSTSQVLNGTREHDADR